LKPLQIIGAAEAESVEATVWYRDRDPRVAEQFVAETRRTLQLVESFPRSEAAYRGWTTGTCVKCRFTPFPITSSLLNCPIAWRSLHSRTIGDDRDTS